MLIRHSAVGHRREDMGRGSKGLCVKVRPWERQEKWMKWVRENLCLWSVDDNYLKDTKICNPALEPRVFT